MVVFLLRQEYRRRVGWKRGVEFSFEGVEDMIGCFFEEDGGWGIEVFDFQEVCLQGRYFFFFMIKSSFGVWKESFIFNVKVLVRGMEVGFVLILVILEDQRGYGVWVVGLVFYFFYL